jgi:hypothetical protein
MFAGWLHQQQQSAGAEEHHRGGSSVEHDHRGLPER